MDIKRILLLTLIYISALASFVSLCLFGVWSISTPDLLLNGFESIGLPSPPPDTLWKEKLLFQFIVGIYGWASLIALFILKNKPIKTISPIWLVGVASGIYIAATWNMNTPSPFSYPPILLSILLLTYTYLNKPNKAVKRD